MRVPARKQGVGRMMGSAPLFLYSTNSTSSATKSVPSLVAPRIAVWTTFHPPLDCGPGIISGRAVEDDGVAAFAADHHIVARLGIHVVVASAAFEEIVSRPARELVVAFAPEKLVMPFVSGQLVVTGKGAQDIVAVTPVHHG
jgi:hypothetical protein